MKSEQQSAEWYRVSYGRVLEILDTSLHGLSSKEAGERLEKIGPNILKRQGGETAVKIFLREFLTPAIELAFDIKIPMLVLRK